MKLLVLAFTVLLSLSAIAGEIIHVDGVAAAKLLTDDPSVTVIDVRTSDEFEEGHIQNAKNIDFQEESFKGLIAKLDKNKPYLVHCAAGGRSTAALDLFEKLGFAKIHHLDGGIKAWVKAGNPTTK